MSRLVYMLVSRYPPISFSLKAVSAGEKMNSYLRILVVEDDLNDVAILEHMLIDAGRRFELIFVLM
jgi:hypothetical protein